MSDTNTQPSTARASATGTQERPRDLTADDFALMSGTLSTDGATEAEAPAPTMTPPTSGATASAAGTISGQQITALWSNAASRNAYVHLATAGWKQLSTLSDNGSSNLTQLASSARQSGSAPYVVDDAAGMVTQLYVW
jgi:hypothetical protein